MCLLHPPPLLQVCAFAGETDIDMKGKVIIRLKNITDLQDRLGRCMAGDLYCIKELLVLSCDYHVQQPIPSVPNMCNQQIHTNLMCTTCSAF